MQNNKKIGQILFRKIFIWYVLIAFTFTSYHIYAQYNLAKSTIIKDMQAIEKDFYNALSNSIWHFDEEQIKANVEAIYSIHGIIGVSTINANNEVFVQKGTLSLEEKKYNEFIYEKNTQTKFSEELITHSFNIYNKEFSGDEFLGKVNLYTSYSAIYDTVKKSLYFILIYSFFIIFSLWILLNFFAERLLTRPLNRIIQATKEFDIEEYKEIKLADNKNYGELNVFVDKFNNMSKKINDSYEHLKHISEIQEQQKQELVVANQAKDDFLANISHELKTPLNSINLLSATMMKNKQQELNEKHVKSLVIINRCGKDLLSLINDILDISNLESGKLDLDIETIDIQTMYKNIVDMFTPQIKQKGLNFIYECDKSLESIKSDKKRIVQVLKNLLSNALKFTSNGNIKLFIQNQGNYIKIIVEDDGIGISEEKQKDIFDRFKQADTSTTREYGGTGLGLAISKELVELLHGKITLHSVPNKGTKFTFEIPKEIQTLNNPTLNTKPIVKKKEKLPSSNIVFNDTTNEKDILILNNDPIVFLKLIVEIKKVFNITQVESVKKLLHIYKSKKFQYILIDISKLKDLNFLEEIKKSKIILLYDDTIDEALKKEVTLTIKKPTNKDFLTQISNI